MWPDLYNSLSVPLDVSLWINRDGTLLSALDDPRQQEVLEHPVVLAERASVPAEPVKGQRMRLDPTRAGLGSGHGLVGYLRAAGAWIAARTSRRVSGATPRTGVGVAP